MSPWGRAPRGPGWGSALLLSLLLGGCAGAKGGPGHVIRVTDKGFEPPVTEVAKGQPATLVVTRESDQTCATEMVFASLDTTYDLPLNQPVRIELKAGHADTLRFACGMDMYRGMVVAK